MTEGDPEEPPFVLALDRQKTYLSKHLLICKADGMHEGDNMLCQREFVRQLVASALLAENLADTTDVHRKLHCRPPEKLQDASDQFNGQLHTHLQNAVQKVQLT